MIANHFFQWGDFVDLVDMEKQGVVNWLASNSSNSSVATPAAGHHHQQPRRGSSGNTATSALQTDHSSNTTPQHGEWINCTFDQTIPIIPIFLPIFKRLELRASCTIASAYNQKKILTRNYIIFTN